MAQKKFDRDSARPDRKQAIALAHLADLANGVPATPAERGYDACPCSEDCSLHGSCRLCTAYHGRKGRLPRCER